MSKRQTSEATVLGMKDGGTFRVQYPTSTEGEEEDLNLLALGEQLHQVKLERDRVDAVIGRRGLPCEQADRAHTRTHCIHIHIV